MRYAHASRFATSVKSFLAIIGRFESLFVLWHIIYPVLDKILAFVRSSPHNTLSTSPQCSSLPLNRFNLLFLVISCSSCSMHFYAYNCIVFMPFFSDFVFQPFSLGFFIEIFITSAMTPWVSFWRYTIFTASLYQLAFHLHSL